MLKFWIRVNARLADDAEVRAFARAIYPRGDIRTAVLTTCGLLVTLWGRIADEQEDGDLMNRDDGALEEWAKWPGKPGMFAAAFRAAFVSDGKVKEWDEYQGTLMARRERDRERKRGGKSRGIPKEHPKEGDGNSSRNGNGNGQPVVSSPNGEERQQAADSALAPQGARVTAPGTGNYQDTPAAQEALRQRGHRPDPVAPRAAVDTRPLAVRQAEEFAARSAFQSWLEERADAWIAANPETARGIGAGARAHLELPAEISSRALSVVQLRMLRQEVIERIRQYQEWPSFAEWAVPA